MNKIVYFILLFFTVTNCSFKKVSDNHGVPFLNAKEKKLFINQSNKNDIIDILGYPSTISKFDNNVWIYIERRQTQSELKSLGEMKIYKNQILVLKLNEKGILENKRIYTIKNMNDLKVAKKTTENIYKKDSFLYNFFSSMRQKVNDPLGQRAKKRKEVANQR